MMVVTVEVWPGGRKAERYIIDQMAFANRSELAEESEYDVWLDGPPGADWTRAAERGQNGYLPDITRLRHKRSDGALELVRKALHRLHMARQTGKPVQTLVDNLNRMEDTLK